MHSDFKIVSNLHVFVSEFKLKMSQFCNSVSQKFMLLPLADTFF
ncbi:hypothetical protein GLIP_4142 [Aliiglaciecola lipolytica E3]|uniref:Uncharacterized protein n=1 Tax=Aliiglaciecola lipolytica E3 TaxID=1127673 RepID=K6YJG3_9ALTE|nr:hypothetical protein GLIP_4142 [Aliiglaciecola lipolytica E3]